MEEEGGKGDEMDRGGLETVDVEEEKKGGDNGEGDKLPAAGAAAAAAGAAQQQQSLTHSLSRATTAAEDGVAAAGLPGQAGRALFSILSPKMHRAWAYSGPLS